MNSHKNFVLAAAMACALTVSANPAVAVVSPAGGYILTERIISDTAQSCVAEALGGHFVVSGPSFTGAAQQVVFVDGSGDESVVANDLNSVGDCFYEASTDTLYVSDNGLEAPGSVTGDTVFAIPFASTASGVSVSGLELVAAGSLPFAASVVVNSAGDVLVSESVGFGAGSVSKISGGVLSPFISGLEFTSGLALDADGDLFVADADSTAFDVTITEYDSGGVSLGVFSGPTFAHGSFDLAFDLDGNLLATGAFLGDVVSLDASAVGTPFAGGMEFSTGLSVNTFTGRVTILSSTFPPSTESRTLHQFTPVSRLVPGRGSDRSECAAELYGLELVPKKLGRPARQAICVDGDACDADGLINDECVFPVGVCFNIDDPEFPECGVADIEIFSAETKPTKTASPEVAALSVEVVGALPISGSACFFSDGARVPVKITGFGNKRPGRKKIKIKTERPLATPRKDRDSVKMVCSPVVP